MEFGLILGVLKEGLKLWNSFEATKYLDRIIKLEKEYYEEIAKPEDERSQLTLDTIILRIRLISQSFVQYPGKK